MATDPPFYFVGTLHQSLRIDLSTFRPPIRQLARISVFCGALRCGEKPAGSAMVVWQSSGLCMLGSSQALVLRTTGDWIVYVAAIVRQLFLDCLSAMLSHSTTDCNIVVISFLVETAFRRRRNCGCQAFRFSSTNRRIKSDTVMPSSLARFCSQRIWGSVNTTDCLTLIGTCIAPSIQGVN
jgi:hypothetical protein